MSDMLEVADRLEAETDHYPVNIPDCKLGDWQVINRVVTPGEVMLDNLRRVRDEMPEMVVAPGISYTVLHSKKHGVMMSNTQLEYRTNKQFITEAHGDVLIGGLGIGMVIRPLAEKDDVTSITILEKDPDVIKLIAPHYADVHKLNIVEADVFDFDVEDLMHRAPKSGKFETIFMDIWPMISEENLEEMTTLRARYRRMLFKGGYIECWAEKLCRRMKRRDARWMPGF